MKPIRIYWLFTVVVLFMTSLNMVAQTTNITVRVKAKDAKFIGTSIGGAKILIREDLSGKVLAEGVTSGRTGDTDKIMKQDWKRGEQLSDDKTAGYTAKLDIDKPTFVTIEAYGPVNKRQAMVLSSTQLWVIPGKDITGDGVVLEIPGFVVDILNPQTHERIKASDPITIKANIVMMCGCPVTKDGIWDATQYEVKALITNDNGNSLEKELKIEEKESTFSTNISLEKGLYEVLVYAYDPVTGNTGVDITNIIVN